MGILANVDFEWDEWSDQQVQEFSNNSGIAGALIFIPAAWLLVLGGDDSALWLFGGMLCAFGRTRRNRSQRDIGWRRLYAMIGVSIGFLCIWGDIDSGIMKGLMLILAALTLFMLGILYMTRAGLEMRGTGAEADFQLPTLFTPQQEVAVHADIPEPVTEDIPEPVTEDTPESVTEDVPEAEIPDSATEDDSEDELKKMVDEITEKHQQMFGENNEVEQQEPAIAPAPPTRRLSTIDLMSFYPWMFVKISKTHWIQPNMVDSGLWCGGILGAKSYWIGCQWKKSNF